MLQEETMRAIKTCGLRIGRKGGFAIESLAALVLVVFTAAVVFFLVSSGVVAVEGSEGASNAPTGSESLLNTQFIPVSQGGTLVAKDMVFCVEKNVDQVCDKAYEREVFYLGEEVHFSFEVVTSAQYGKVELRENYQIYGPDGSLLLSVDDSDDVIYKADTSETLEQVFFHDYFILGYDSPIGDYTLELVMTNPLVNKEAVIRKTVTVFP